MFELLGFVGLGILALISIYVYAVVQNKVYLGFYVFKMKNIGGKVSVGVCEFPKFMSFFIAPFLDKYSA